MRALLSRRAPRQWRSPEPIHTPLWSLNLPTRVRCHFPGVLDPRQRCRERSQGSCFCSRSPRGSLVAVKSWDAGSLTLEIRCPTRIRMPWPLLHSSPSSPLPREKFAGRSAPGPADFPTRAGGAGPPNHSREADSSVLFLGPHLKTQSSKAFEEL